MEHLQQFLSEKRGLSFLDASSLHLVTHAGL